MKPWLPALRGLTLEGILEIRPGCLKPRQLTVRGGVGAAVAGDKEEGGGHIIHLHLAGFAARGAAEALGDGNHSPQTQRPSQRRPVSLETLGLLPVSTGSHDSHEMEEAGRTPFESSFAWAAPRPGGGALTALHPLASASRLLAHRPSTHFTRTPRSRCWSHPWAPLTALAHPLHPTQCWDPRTGRGRRPRGHASRSDQ